MAHFWAEGLGLDGGGGCEVAGGHGVELVDGAEGVAGGVELHRGEAAGAVSSCAWGPTDSRTARSWSDGGGTAWKWLGVLTIARRAH
jgi:hypothetical protein